MADSPTLQHVIRRLVRIRRAGWLLVGFISLLAIAITGIFIHGIIDATLALSSTARLILHALLATLLLVTAIAGFTRIMRIRQTSIGDAIDQSHNDPRKSVRSAIELSQQESTSPLSELMRAQAIGEASTLAAQTPNRSVMPRRALRSSLIVITSLALVVLTTCLIYRDATAIVFQRLLKPTADIPPYSTLNFEFADSDLRTPYGGTALVKVHITGDSLPGPVEAMVRTANRGTIQEIRPFQEGSDAFAIRLENLTEPVEVAFATGRARSHWQPVDVVLQPNITRLHGDAKPPAYTARPSHPLELSTGEFSVLEGSTVNLTVESNRPLAGGSLELVDTDAPPVNATAGPNANSLTFSWQAYHSGPLLIHIRDTRETPSAEPTELLLKSIPDQPPVVSFSEPGTLAFATPDSVIPLKADIRDDIRLTRLRLVRTLAGYRDRSQSLPLDQTREFEWQHELDLEPLGVVPGDTLEFFIEAADNNPNLTGLGTSNISTVRIISTEQYAEAQRAITSIEEFNRRFHALGKALEKAIESIDELEKSLASNDPEELRSAFRNTLEEHQEARQLLSHLADDFQAFELESRLREIASALRSNVNDNIDELSRIQPHDRNAIENAIPRLRQRLAPHNEAIENLENHANIIGAFAGIIDMARQLREIRDNQESLALRLSTLARDVLRGELSNLPNLPSLGRMQNDNAEALDLWQQEMQNRIEALPPELDDLAADSSSFLDHLTTLEIQPTMEGAGSHAENGNSRDAAELAVLALTLLDELIHDLEDNMFAAILRSQFNQLEFQIPDIAATIEQWMQQLVPGDQLRRGIPNPNEGGGRGGEGGDGFSMGRGMNPSAFPMFGPHRHRFDSPSSRGRSPTDRHTTESEESTLMAERDDDPATSQPRTERQPVPDLYRDAVRRYFEDPDPSS